jgi:hypothetical protein
MVMTVTAKTLFCMCGGWSNWDEATSDWHEPGCPYPLSVDTDQGTDEYRAWFKRFALPTDEREPTVTLQEESYTEWRDRVFGSATRLGG